MKSRQILTALSLPLYASTAFSQGAAPAREGTLDRTVLPIQFPKQPALKEQYAKDVKQIPPRQEAKAPAGAPNVLVILIDDLGFGATETFGGPLKTPTLQPINRM